MVCKREKVWIQCINTLYGHSFSTELTLEAYRTLYPQYIPASSLGLDDETIWSGESRKMQNKKSKPNLEAILQYGFPEFTKMTI